MHLRRCRVILGGVFFCLVMTSYLPALSLAAQALFSVAPLLLEFNSTPGTTKGFALEITNQSPGQDATLRLRAVPLKQESSGRYVEDPTGDNPHSAAPWVTFDTPQFTVAGGSRHLVVGQVQIPRNYHGGAYAGLVVESVPKERDSGIPEEVTASLEVSYRFMVVMELAVGSNVRRGMHITEIKVAGVEEPGMEALAQRYGGNVLRISAVAENTGNVHVRGQGSISIRDMNGRKVKEIPLGAGRGVVIPGAQVEFASVIAAGLPAGIYSLQAVVSYGGMRPAITRQTVTIGSSSVEVGSLGRGLRMLVEPALLQPAMKPGSLRTALVRVQNLEAEPILVRSEVVPLVFGPDGSAYVSAEESAFSASSWIEVRPSEIRLPAGQRRNIQLVLKAPADMTGGRYAQVVMTGSFESDALPDQDTGTEEACQVFVTSETGLRRSGEIVLLQSVVSPDGSQMGVGLVIANTGNIHTQASARARLFRQEVSNAGEGIELIGEPIKVQVAEGFFPALPGPILPLETRQMSLLLEGPFQPGSYVVEVTVDMATGIPLTASTEISVAKE